jgi:predicted Zn finger-like uncharacterized protein
MPSKTSPKTDTSAIVTRCPTCQTAFRVTSEQLLTANGMVRCGKCIGVFNAPEHQLNSVTEQPEQTPIKASQAPETDQPLPQLTELIHNEFNDQQPSPKQSKTLRTLLGRLTIAAVGAVVLAAQIIYFTSAELSRNENYRQALIDSCYYLGCKIAPYRDLSKLSINTFIIQSHPTQTGAVVVDMLIENKAQFRQPYPRIKVRFDDLKGQIIAQRIFSPDEYIAEKNLGRSSAIKNISGGRQTHVSFSLLDPGLHAANYLVELSL